LQNIEDKHVDQCAKKYDTLSRPRVASDEPPWFDTTRFLKNVCLCRKFMQCYGAHCGVKLL